jgi:hypothetical protein
LENVTGKEIIDFYQQFSFSDRHLKSLRGHPRFDKYFKLISDNYVDWKKIDALSSLDLLCNMTSSSSAALDQKFYSGYNHVNFYNDSAITTGKGIIDRSNLPETLSATNNLPKLLYDSYNRSLAVKFAKYLGIANSKSDIDSFTSYVETLKFHDIRFSNLPLSYSNYSLEIIDQELLILKLHLWFIDSSGLAGNLGSVSDYFSSSIPLEQSISSLSAHDSTVFYDSFLRLLSDLSPTPNEILSKYLGQSREQFCSVSNLSNVNKES